MSLNVHRESCDLKGRFHRLPKHSAGNLVFLVGLLPSRPPPAPIYGAGVGSLQGALRWPVSLS